MFRQNESSNVLVHNALYHTLRYRYISCQYYRYSHTKLSVHLREIKTAEVMYQSAELALAVVSAFFDIKYELSIKF